jgi:2-desacetyl-2-hydroxyethyl bacteriochlorophyllide A dehydrogenase
MNGGVTRALWFTDPRRAEIREEELPALAPNQVRVRAVTSLVSSGTEMRVYRGELDPEMPLGLETFGGSARFPIKYAYQIVGDIIEAGLESGYDVGERVFARHPHQELFNVRADPFLLSRVPKELDAERAVFANLLDVALNCMLDVPVRIGDVVVVFGQGTIGAFCAQLARRTAGRVIVVDPIESRRRAAIEAGADAAVHPREAREAVYELSGGRGADISIEVSGAPAALQQAFAVTGQEGTIAVVSFFGARIVELVLAPEFHFRRLRMISSQVRGVSSALQARWTLDRRFESVFWLLQDESLLTPISHIFPFERAPEAYTLLDEHPEETQGVILRYDGASLSSNDGHE